MTSTPSTANPGVLLEEINWSEPGDDVYDERTFDARFIEDLQTAHSLVLIESPYLNPSRIQKYAPVLLSLTRRGVQVCVFVQEPWGWDRRDGSTIEQDGKLRQLDASVQALRNLGVHVTLKKALHTKSAIIDARILWRGSLNILSFSNTIEEMVRKESLVECLRSIKRRDLHQCQECLAMQEKIQGTNLISNADQLAKLIVRKRTALGISQEQLARRARVNRTVLAHAENGTRMPSIDKLLAILDGLQQSLVIMPSGAHPFLEELLQLAASQSTSKQQPSPASVQSISKRPPSAASQSGQ